MLYCWLFPGALRKRCRKPNVLRDKIVIDAMNPYRPDGGFYDLGGSTSSEEVLKRMPDARLVKAFNTIYYVHLANRGRNDLPLDERHTIYVAGDDAEAKKLVARLIEEIGFAAIDTGSLREGGRSAAARFAHLQQDVQQTRSPGVSGKTQAAAIFALQPHVYITRHI